MFTPKGAECEEKMKKIYNRYKHSIPLIIYMAVYGAWFAYLEKAVTHPQTIIHVKLDDYIPFCEVFVIPYFLWFPFSRKQDSHKIYH